MQSNRRIIKQVESESITIFIPIEMKQNLKAIGNGKAATGLREVLESFEKEIKKEADHARKRFQKGRK